MKNTIYMRAKLLHVTVTYTVHPMFFFFLVQGLQEVIDPKVAELEENNALALAIIPPGRD